MKAQLSKARRKVYDRTQANCEIVSFFSRKKAITTLKRTKVSTKPVSV